MWTFFFSFYTFMHTEHLEVFNHSCSFDSAFYRNTLGQTQTCIQKSGQRGIRSQKCRVKTSSHCCLHTVAIKSTWTLLAYDKWIDFLILIQHTFSCVCTYGHLLYPVKLKLEKHPPSLCLIEYNQKWTSIVYIFFFYFHQPNWDLLCLSAQPGCNDQASVLYSLLWAIEVQFGEAFIFNNASLCRFVSSALLAARRTWPFLSLLSPSLIFLAASRISTLGAVINL